MKKIEIRSSVFETNSSSTHSITICSKEDYEKFKEGILLYDYENEKLVSKEEKNNEDEDNYYFRTFEDYWGDPYLEFFEKEYTTKSGEVIVAFGKYGHD